MPTHCYSNADLLNCGRQDGLRHTGEGLAVEREGQSGIYVSRIYDSGREGTQWNQLCLDIGKGVLLQVYVWLFDRMEESEEGLCQEDVRQWFTGKKASAQYHSEYRNVLLFGHGRGRYACRGVKRARYSADMICPFQRRVLRNIFRQFIRIIFSWNVILPYCRIFIWSWKKRWISCRNGWIMHCAAEGRQSDWQDGWDGGNWPGRWKRIL